MHAALSRRDARPSHLLRLAASALPLAPRLYVTSVITGGFHRFTVG